MQEFGFLNWSIVGVYMLGTLFMGYWLSRRITAAEHYYLGEHASPWWAIGLSVVATYIGAMSFLGGPAWSYADGFSVIMIHINYPIAVFIVATVFLPFFFNSGVASIFDYLERRFGLSSRTLMSAVFLFGNIAYSGIMLYTTALVLQFITGVDVVAAIVVIAIVALVYTTMGGIAAVIWTDVAQTVILLAGALVILALLITALPDGLAGSLMHLKANGMTNPFNTSTDPSVVATIWTGIVAMSIYHVVVYGVNQMMVQRTLTAASIGDAKKSYMLMGYSAIFIFALLFLIGILLNEYYHGREFENGNTIILEFTSAAGVPGLMGVIAAAVVAASMSSLDSSLNSMATVTTLDFYQKFFKRDGNSAHYLKATRYFTVAWGAFIVLPALLFISSEGSVLEILSKIGSFFVGAKLGCYGLGFYSKHATERGVLIGVAAGFLSLWALEVWANVAWPWYCAVGGFVTVAVGWTASVLLDGWQQHYHPYTVRGQAILFAAENRPLKQDGWYLLPGKVDPWAYGLLVFFALSLFGLWLFQYLI
jgi:SSS family solute:Na+ symporter